jgi:hypothetical protein
LLKIMYKSFILFYEEDIALFTFLLTKHINNYDHFSVERFFTHIRSLT